MSGATQIMVFEAQRQNECVRAPWRDIMVQYPELGLWQGFLHKIKDRFNFTLCVGQIMGSLGHAFGLLSWGVTVVVGVRRKGGLILRHSKLRLIAKWKLVV